MKTAFIPVVSLVTASLMFGCISLTASILTVTTTSDTGAGSLRAALKNARSGDTIKFSLPAPSFITLTSGELLVSKNLNILGPGAGNLTVSGNHSSRVFRIGSRATVTLAGLTITQGVTTGYGGGIYSDHAALTVSNCVVTGNSANNNTGGGVGGGIYSDGTSSNVIQPKAGYATLNVVNCLVTANSCGNTGGGIVSDATSNTGGSVAATILDSIVHGNSSGYIGGGIANLGATMTVIRCTVSDNTAPNLAGSGLGGGLYNGGTMTVRDSSLIENSASGGGGGIHNWAGTLNIVNSTLSGNMAGTPGDSFTGVGGGIRNFGYGKLTVLNCTFSGNSAYYGSSIAALGSSQTIGGTILNAGPGAGNIYGGIVTSLGYNLSSDSGTDLLLGPLQDNGGPTWTHAPLPGSPAIDAGKNFSGSATDQRGLPRTLDYLGVPNAPAGDGSDIGAVEVQ